LLTEIIDSIQIANLLIQEPIFLLQRIIRFVKERSKVDLEKILSEYFLYFDHFVCIFANFLLDNSLDLIEHKLLAK